MSKTKAPTTFHPTDVHVGQRVRRRRREMKLSQIMLSDELDLTFQQVQKYESGANRISASKLYAISQALDVPMDYFFEGLPFVDTSNADPKDAKTFAFVQSQEGVELAAFFSRLPSAKRRMVITLVKNMTGLSL